MLPTNLDLNVFVHTKKNKKINLIQSSLEILKLLIPKEKDNNV